MHTFEAFTYEPGFAYPIKDHKRHTCRLGVAVCLLKTLEGWTMTPELLERLRNAWKTTLATEPDPRNAPPVVAGLESVRAGGVAIAPCTHHMPPFDAIEFEDPRRPGFIRSDCRLCGRFLGYRPKANCLNLEGRG